MARARARVFFEYFQINIPFCRSIWNIKFVLFPLPFILRASIVHRLRVCASFFMLNIFLFVFFFFWVNKVHKSIRNRIRKKNRYIIFFPVESTVWEERNEKKVFLFAIGNMMNEFLSAGKNSLRKWESIRSEFYYISFRFFLIHSKEIIFYLKFWHFLLLALCLFVSAVANKWFPARMTYTFFFDFVGTRKESTK